MKIKQVGLKIFREIKIFKGKGFFVGFIKANGKLISGSREGWVKLERFTEQLNCLVKPANTG